MKREQILLVREQADVDWLM